MEAIVYNQTGKETGKIKLPEAVFARSWNADLVHQVTVSMMSNARTPVAHTKDRSEVRGGGKKPWKQKGTGRARHGSIRSPIWVGGGVAHGPTKEKNYSKKINKKMRSRALLSVLSRKLADKEIIFIDSLSVKDPKTTEAKKIFLAISKISDFKTLATKKKNALLISLPKRDELLEKSFRNFGNVEVGQAKDLNPVKLLKYKYALIAGPEDFLDLMSKRI